MSTRGTVHFQRNGEDRAIIYRHHDGYQEGLGRDLERFFDDVSHLRDTRFNDPSYLAAKFVVWQAAEYAESPDKLNFISLGVVLKDTPDTEYVYLVECADENRPTVKVQNLYA